MEYQEFDIQKDYQHIYKFLKEKGLSERFLSFLRGEYGRILLNDTPVNIKAPLKTGDKLRISCDSLQHTLSVQPCIIPLDIVYEDAYYLLVNKSSGLATIPSRSHYNNNLSGAILHYLPNSTLRVINRLDIDTAGIVIFAKNLLAINLLRTVKKTYYAFCAGQISQAVIIDKPIETLQENGINVRKRVISSAGKTAKTFIYPIKQYGDYSLVKVNIEHGRTHQIRVHMASIDHPLLGDTLYGKPDSRISHSALLCKEVSFFHPFLNKQMNFEVDYPEDFKKLL